MKSSRPADLDSMGKSNESIRLLHWRNGPARRGCGLGETRSEGSNAHANHGMTFYVLQQYVLQHIKTVLIEESNQSTRIRKNCSPFLQSNRRIDSLDFPIESKSAGLIEVAIIWTIIARYLPVADMGTLIQNMLQRKPLLVTE